MLKKALGLVAGLTLAYIVVSSVPDVVRYIKITRM
jgi:hypothetical protein